MNNINSKCSNCNESLYLSDVESNKWFDDFEEFVLKCSYCGKEHTIKIKLFDDHGHISNYNLEMLKVEKKYLPEHHLQRINDHLAKCESCAKALNECLLNEIETKIKFNDKTFNFFIKNSNEILQKIVKNDSKFSFEGKEYYIKEDDLFYKDNRRICYYLRFNYCLAGLISFLVSDPSIIERIWFRKEESVLKEQKFFQDLKDKKIKLDLQTLELIFKRIR